MVNYYILSYLISLFLFTHTYGNCVSCIKNTHFHYIINHMRKVYTYNKSYNENIYYYNHIIKKNYNKTISYTKFI